MQIEIVLSLRGLLGWAAAALHTSHRLLSLNSNWRALKQ